MLLQIIFRFPIPSVAIIDDIVYPKQKPLYIMIPYTIGIPITVDPTNHNASTNKKFEIGTSSGLPIISNGNTVEIVFQNNRKYQLPETGGIGIEPPIMASGISVIATSGYVVILRKKGWWSKKKK